MSESWITELDPTLPLMQLGMDPVIDSSRATEHILQLVSQARSLLSWLVNWCWRVKQVECPFNNPLWIWCPFRRAVLWHKGWLLCLISVIHLREISTFNLRTQTLVLFLVFVCACKGIDVSSILKILQAHRTRLFSYLSVHPVSDWLCSVSKMAFCLRRRQNGTLPPESGPQKKGWKGAIQPLFVPAFKCKKRFCLFIVK